MISLTEINKMADQCKVPAETIEKDYAISWILCCLSKSKLRHDFIFYGGTAIKRIYFEDHRFSEDIDLISAHQFTLAYLLQALSSLQYARDDANFNLSVNQNNIITTKDRVQLFIRYAGYDEIIGAPKEVRLDFAMNMPRYGTTVNRKIIKSYSDLVAQNKTRVVMDLNTILGNKLGMLMDVTRNEPRDLFDSWFLLKRMDPLELDSEKIRQAFKEKYGFRPTSNVLLSYVKNPRLKAHWTTRLSKQIALLPDINLVVKEVGVNLKKLF